MKIKREMKREMKEKQRREVKEKRKHRTQTRKEAAKSQSSLPRKSPLLKKVEELRVEDLKNYEESEKLDALNTIYQTILEYPERHLHMLKEILILVQDNNRQVLMRTLATLCELFVDIMPSYKIRVDKSEEETKLSKEVRQLHQYEADLLQYYSQYIKILQTFLAYSAKDESFIGVKEVAADCAGRLLEELPHMNFGKNVLQLVVRQLPSEHPKIRARATEALGALLSKSELASTVMEIKLSAVREIGKLIKIKPHNSFDRRILDVLKFYKIQQPQSVNNPKIDQLRGEIKKKKHKKSKRDDRDLEKALVRELHETNAISIDSHLLARYNTDIVREILAIYFIVLKDFQKSPLLMSVLEGLPKVAPHIDQGIVSDILAVVRNFLKSSFVEKNLDYRNMCAALKSGIEIAKVLRQQNISNKYENYLCEQ